VMVAPTASLRRSRRSSMACVAAAEPTGPAARTPCTNSTASVASAHREVIPSTTVCWVINNKAACGRVEVACVCRDGIGVGA